MNQTAAFNASDVHVRDLTAEEIETYHRDGVVHLSGLVDAATCACLLAAADRRLEGFRRDKPNEFASNFAKDGTFLSERECYKWEPVFNHFVMTSRMAEVAAQALRSEEVRFYFDHLFMLDKDCAKDEYYWHQDMPYWGCGGTQICSFWLALTPCSVDSGALEFVKGTDKGRLYLPTSFGRASDDRFARLETEAVPEYHRQRDAYEIVSWDIQAGDCMLFNARIMHSSRGNHSKTQRRVAYSTRWIGDDAVFEPKRGFQDPVTYPEEGFPPGEKLARSNRFPLLWGRRDRAMSAGRV
jgi:ectoine hydroxylase-related dioxygenase (phytanoyl-CoA dioxygenase family)